MIKNSFNRTSLAILDLCLSTKSMFEGAFGFDKKCRQTQERILGLRLKRFHLHHPSVASAQVALARSIILEFNKSPINKPHMEIELQRADNLCCDAFSTLIREGAPLKLQVGRVLHLRGLIQRRLGVVRRAQKFFAGAEVIFARANPISFERVANLDKLGEMLDAIGDHNEATRIKLLSSELYSILMRTGFQQRLG